MQIPAFKSQLSPLERHHVRALVFKDAVALLSILFITILLAVATHFLFKSYSDHREELANRWFSRGKSALDRQQPNVAIDDFRSALLYAPPASERQMEIALASALASAGRIQEATAYFNTLREAEPGNGEINLQLARLAARAGNEDLAKQDFHAAIYGNWEGDGYIRRRETRLELVRYLISRGSFDQARSELLVASGNAPSSDLEVQLKIAGLLVESHFPVDALELYRQLLAQHPEDFTALQGAADTSYGIGDYAAAYRYLQKSLTVPSYVHRSTELRQMDQDQLHRIGRILVLDPSTATSTNMLATRLINDREIARQRVNACLVTKGGAPVGGQPGSTPDATGSGLATISARWNAEPDHLTVADLANDPVAQENERKLIYDTELATAKACGSPTGDDAILLRLAEVPSLSDMQAEQIHE
jgi:tetratricopeptide (TPR) repeat protein